jgi:hypothetical protein
MKIEAMVGYHGSLRVIRPPTDVKLAQLQGEISALTEKIQELTIPIPGNCRSGAPNVIQKYIW